MASFYKGLIKTNYSLCKNKSIWFSVSFLIIHYFIHFKLIKMKTILSTLLLIMLSLAIQAQTISYCGDIVGGTVSNEQLTQSGTNFTFTFDVAGAAGQQAIVYVFDQTDDSEIFTSSCQPIATAFSSETVSYTSTVPIGNQYVYVLLMNGDPDPFLNAIYCLAGQFIASVGPTVICNTILPIKLSSFTAKHSGIGNVLNWTTEFEINAAYFDVERNINGEFIKIATLAAQDNMNGASYSYIDADALNGDVLYRLKMVDKDGKFAYSDTRKVSVKGKSSVLVYPNPSRGDVNISVSEPGANFKGSIWTIAGKQLTSFSIQNNAPFQLTGLEAGTYVIKLLNTKTNKQEVHKLVVLN